MRIGWFKALNEAADIFVAAWPNWLKVSGWLALVTWVGVLVVAVTIHVVQYTAESKDYLLPTPPKSALHEDYTQEQAVPKILESEKLTSTGKSSNGNPNTKQERNSSDDSVAIAEFIKNKRDLNAQEGMWRAANFLVILTVVQVIVGTLTIVFLAWTVITQRNELGAAKETLEEAKKANILDLKPYLDIVDKTLEIKVVDFDTHFLSFSVTFDVINNGKTQARDIRELKVKSGVIHIDTHKGKTHTFSLDSEFHREQDERNYVALSIFNPREKFPFSFGVRFHHPRARLKGVKTIECLETKYRQVCFLIKVSIVFDDIETINASTHRECTVILNKGMFEYPNPGVHPVSYRGTPGIRIVEDTSNKVEKKTSDTTE